MSSNTETKHIAASDTFEVDGKTWVLSQPTIKDLVELEDFLQAEVIRKVGQQLANLPPEFARARFEKAVANSEAIKLGTREYDQAAMAPTGAIHMLYLMLRKTQPLTTKDEALELFTKAANSGILEKMQKLAGYSEVNPQKAQSN